MRARGPRIRTWMLLVALVAVNGAIARACLGMLTSERLIVGLGFMPGEYSVRLLVGLGLLPATNIVLLAAWLRGSAVPRGLIHRFCTGLLAPSALGLLAYTLVLILAPDFVSLGLYRLARSWLLPTAASLNLLNSSAPGARMAMIGLGLGFVFAVCSGVVLVLGLAGGMATLRWPTLSADWPSRGIPATPRHRNGRSIR
jgi:hypothetical protein